MVHKFEIITVKTNLSTALFLALVLLVSCITSDNLPQSKDIVLNHSLPVVFINASENDLWSDSNGIYVEGLGSGENWQGLKANYFAGVKIPIEFQYYFNGERVLSQNAQMKVSGGGSRKQPQKSFNISSKEPFNYPFFKSKSITNFKSFRLRVSGQDWRSTLLRDALMHSLIEETNIDYQAYQPVVLYLNNKYWGIYNLREKFTQHYIRQNHIDVAGKIDILENNSQVKSGSNKDYNRLMDFVKSNNLSDSLVYAQLENWIDISNFIDYYCAQIYFANTDWPGNNIKYWRSQTDTSKWRWFLHDTDLGFGFAPIWSHPGGVNHNTIAFALNDSTTTYHNQAWSTLLFRSLLKNAKFKESFLSSFAFHLGNTFHPHRVVNHIDSLCNTISAEIPHHISRWASEADYAIQSIEEWKVNIKELKAFGEKRPAIIQNYFYEQFGLTSKDWDLLEQKKSSENRSSLICK